MSSKWSSAVSLEWLPIFLSFFATWKPLVFVGTRKKLQPCAPCSGRVFDEQRDEVGAACRS